MSIFHIEVNMANGTERPYWVPMYQPYYDLPAAEKSIKARRLGQTRQMRIAKYWRSESDTEGLRNDTNKRT